MLLVMSILFVVLLAGIGIRWLILALSPSPIKYDWENYADQLREVIDAQSARIVNMGNRLDQVQSFPKHVYHQNSLSLSAALSAKDNVVENLGYRIAELQRALANVVTGEDKVFPINADTHDQMTQGIEPDSYR